MFHFCTCKDGLREYPQTHRKRLNKFVAESRPPDTILAAITIEQATRYIFY